MDDMIMGILVSILCMEIAFYLSMLIDDEIKSRQWLKENAFDWIKTDIEEFNTCRAQLPAGMTERDFVISDLKDRLIKHGDKLYDEYKRDRAEADRLCAEAEAEWEALHL